MAYHAQYSAEHHKEAYLRYYKTRSYARTVDLLQEIRGEEIARTSAYQTLRNWASPEFKCRYGCPWHDWERLIHEQEQRLRNTLVPVNEDGTPSDHPPAERESEQRAGPAPVVTTLISDLDRLMHWETMYAKVFYYVTGIVLPAPLLRNPQGQTMSDRELREQYDAGMRPHTVESSVKTLATIQREIERLRILAGLSHDPDRKGRGTADLDAPQVEVSLPQGLTIEDLRNLRDLYEQTPPEKRAVLAKLMADENSARAMIRREGE